MHIISNVLVFIYPAKNNPSYLFSNTNSGLIKFHGDSQQVLTFYQFEIYNNTIYKDNEKICNKESNKDNDIERRVTWI